MLAVYTVRSKAMQLTRRDGFAIELTNYAHKRKTKPCHQMKIHINNLGTINQVGHVCVADEDTNLDFKVNCTLTFNLLYGGSDLVQLIPLSSIIPL